MAFIVVLSGSLFNFRDQKFKITIKFIFVNGVVYNCFGGFLPLLFAIVFYISDFSES